MKKKFSRLLAMALCLTLSLGLLSSVSLATSSPEPLKYVAIGDSASMGYLMDDYYDNFQHNVNALNGESIESSSSWSEYAQMCTYLTEKGVDFTGKDLSMTGMRTLELRSLLDESYYEAHKSEIIDGSDKTTFWGYHMYEYLNSNGRYGYQTYENIHRIYTEALYDADLITYDLTMNDFGTYLGSRLIAADSEIYANETFAKLMQDEGDSDMAELIGVGAEKISSFLRSALADSGLPVDTIETYVDMILYCFANFALNFSKTMDMIYTNNPDVEIIVVGPYNILNGLTMTVGETELDAGAIWQILNEVETAYICTMDSHRSEYRFADLSDGVETCLDAMAKGDWANHITLASKFLVQQKEIVSYALQNPEYNKDTKKLNTCLANIQKAANYTKINFTEVLGSIGNADTMVKKVIADFDSATDAEKGMTQMYLRAIGVYGLGSHPDVNGYKQKFAAIQKAYESPLAADGSYIVKTSGNIGDFIGEKLAKLLQKNEGLRNVFANLRKLLLAPLQKALALAAKLKALGA